MSAPAEAGEVAAAVVGVDVVGVAVDALGVAVVPLQRDLDPDALALARDLDRLLGQRLLVPVQVLDEGADAAVVLEAVLLVVALVLERDQDPAVQERQLAQALRQRVEAEGRGLEDLRVGLEGDLGAAAVGGARLLEPALRQPARVRLLVDLAVAPDLDARAAPRARSPPRRRRRAARPRPCRRPCRTCRPRGAWSSRLRRRRGPTRAVPPGCRARCRSRSPSCRCGSRPRSRCSSPRAPRRPSCRRPRRPGGAAPTRRSSRCTWRAARGPPRAPPGCGSPRRRTRLGRLPVSSLASRSCPPSLGSPLQAQRTAPPETS